MATASPGLLHRICGWLGCTDLVVLLAVLAVVGGTSCFLAVADQVVEGESQAFDESVLRALRNPNDPADPLGPAWLEDAIRDVTALGGYAVLGLVTTAVVGYLLMNRTFHAVWLVLGATLGGMVLSYLLKGAFARPRPALVPRLQWVAMSSFPSGHSMLSAVVYLTLGALLARLVPGRGSKVYFVAVALVLTGLVGLSRIYLGVHYPTDVLAGWSAGLAWAVLCWLVARHLQRRGVVEPSASHRP